MKLISEMSEMATFSIFLLLQSLSSKYIRYLLYINFPNMQVFSAEVVLAVYSCSMENLLIKLQTRKNLLLSLILTKQQTGSQEF